MENASRALIMAGEVLIAMLIVGLIVYTISTYGGFAKDMTADIEHNRTLEFNNHFTQFDGRADITADEIITTINYAKHSNDSYELYLENGYNENKDSQFFVDVFTENQSFFSNISGSSNESFQTAFETKKNEFLKNNINTFYMCNINKIEKNGKSPDGTQTKIKKVIKNPPTDIQFDTSLGGTGRVIKIYFSKTKTDSSVTNFDPAHRDEFILNNM